MKLVWFILVASVAHADPVSYVASLKTRTMSGSPTVVTAGVFEEQLDHFSVTDSRTFKQRYWITSTYASGANAPVLLSLCGESECGSSALQYGPLPKIARETGAYIVALEHRYYGKSQPFTDFSTANLKFLSTDQAIEDVRAFRNIMRSSKNLNGRWILIGGSYAGDLAAYTRRGFPLEFDGAVASSAPVRPEPNFTAYDHHVAVIAGAQCVADLQNTLHLIEAATSSPDGFVQLRANFKADSVSRRDDFLYLLSDVASAAIQLGLKTEFCQEMKSGIDGYRSMKLKVDTTIADFSQWTAEQAEDISLTKHSSGLGMRQWFYQSCNEYGFWQNAWPDERESARSHEINADYQDHLCQRLFGISRAGDTLSTRQKYFVPLMTLLTTNTLFTKGSLDPWASLGVATRDQFGSGSSVKEIQGALHCEDLTVGGSPEVMQAKQLIDDSIKAWLAQVH